MYARSYKNFAWYKGGKHTDTELDPGGGTKMMSLSDGGLTVSDKFTADGDATLKKSLTVEDDAILKKSLTVSGDDKNKSLRLSPTTAGANMLDVQAAERTTPKYDNNDNVLPPASTGPVVWVGAHPTGLALYLAADSAPDGQGVKFRHSNGTQGIGFGYNTSMRPERTPTKTCF